MPEATESAHAVRLSVVIPAYDEMPNLRELLPRLTAQAASMAGVSTDIVIAVATFTPQHELAEIAALGARPVLRGPTDSFGDAIRTGLAAVDEEVQLVVVMDADGSHDPAAIPRLLEAREGAHVVVASRYTRGGETDNSALLTIMSRTLNLAYRLILRINCKDVSTNFKLYRREDLSGITLTAKDFDVVEELLFRIKMIHGRDLVIREVPDRFFERKHGVTKRKLGPFVVSYLKTLIYLTWLGRQRRR